MELHYFPQSHWSRVIALVLEEKGLEYSRHLVDIRRNESFEPAYMRLNPRGVVPTVVDDGRVVCNSPNIARYLDDKSPPALFEPPGSPDAAHWAGVLEDFPLMHLSYSVWVEGRHGERSDAILDDKIERGHRYASQVPELRALYERKAKFFAEFRVGVYDPGVRRRTQDAARRVLDDMARAVDARPWVGGDDYCFADAIATSILFRLADLRLLGEWHDDPGHPLERYYGRLRARPSFARVWYEDPLLAGL